MWRLSRRWRRQRIMGLLLFFFTLLLHFLLLLFLLLGASGPTAVVPFSTVSGLRAIPAPGPAPTLLLWQLRLSARARLS